jgi:hypothetical protein
MGGQACVLYGGSEFSRDTQNPKIVQELRKKRRLLGLSDCTEEELALALTEEEKKERKADRLYWRPLLEELEKSRHGRGSQVI